MNRPVRILELRSVRGTGGGPEKTILLGAARSNPEQFSVTVCYLRDVRDDVFSVDVTAGSLPVDYVEVREKHSFDPSIWSRLRHLIRQRQIDIVHAHDYKTNLLAFLLARVEPVVALSTVHGWTGTSTRERLLYYPADKRLLPWFPMLVAVSGGIRDELLHHGAKPDRVVTLLNGIDHRRFHRDRNRDAAVRRQLGVGPGDVVIGAVGRLEQQKRFDLLIDAFAQVRRNHPRLGLLVVGDGSLREPLQEQIARLGLGESCRLLGHRTDIIDLHHAMDLFVQSSDYEGTPNAVLEAMALETPLVATDVGGTAELVRNGIDGLIVQPGSTSVLAEAIRAALDGPDAARARAASARTRVETVLSFDARMEALEAIYTELFERRNARRVTPAVVRT